MANNNYLVKLTQFHGGREISHHRTLQAALRAQRRISGDCTCCGCAGIIRQSDGAILAHGLWSLGCDPDGREIVVPLNAEESRAVWA